MKKNKKASSEDFWKDVHRTAKEVEAWPEWMRTPSVDSILRNDETRRSREEANDKPRQTQDAKGK